MSTNEPHSIEQAKKKLFSKSKSGSSYKTHPLKEKRDAVPTSWHSKGAVTGTAVRRAKQSSLFRNFFFGSIAVFVLSAGFAAWTFFGGSNTVSGEKIDIDILGNSFVAGGAALPLQVEVTNRNSSALELADLIIEYPKGSGLEAGGETVKLREPLGTIAAGATKAATTEVVLFGERGSTKDIRVSVEYRAQDSNAIFVKERLFSVTISSSPISLAVQAPTESNVDRTIELTVRTTVAPGTPTEGLRLEVQYPPGFRFESADPEPVFGTTLWSLEGATPGEEEVISIRGAMLGVEGDERSFRIYAGAANPGDQSKVGVSYNSLLHTLRIQRPGLEARLTVNDQTSGEATLKPGETVSGSIEWVNNTATRIDDVELRLELSGNAFNEDGVNAFGGFYDTAAEAITWNKSTYAQFSSIQPGERGTVPFVITSLPSAELLLLSNPEIAFDVSISGSTVSGSSRMSIDSAERKIAKVSSDARLSAVSSHLSGPFENSGPVPPVAERETTYAVTWRLTNSTSQIADAEVRATLPVYVRFTGLVSPAGEQVTYDESTREIRWRAGAVSRGVGTASAARQVSFQVALTPSGSQAGSVPALTSQARLSARDVYTGASLSATAAAVSTRTQGDAGSSAADGVVVE